MDDIDRRIIELLAGDARRSLADISGAVGLSPSTVNERIRRLGASGTIRRFTVDADPAALGLSVRAFVWVALAPGAEQEAFGAFARTHPAIAECHHVTGPWSYLVKIHVASLAGMEGFLGELRTGGLVARSETVIALSSPVPGPFLP
jgi:Lrp/AsnC family leucine-responsive transcriptional regulator